VIKYTAELNRTALSNSIIQAFVYLWVISKMPYSLYHCNFNYFVCEGGFHQTLWNYGFGL